MATITGQSSAGTATEAEQAVDLTIGGMTCASCAARIQKKLNKLDGVSATVNLATETASVSVPDGMTAADLIAVVEQPGYPAALPAPAAQDGEAAAQDGETAALRRRVLVTAALAV